MFQYFVCGNVKDNKWGHFQMEPALPSQGSCLAGLEPQISGMLKQGKKTFGPGLGQSCFPNAVCKDHRKADTGTTGLKV